MKFNAILSTLIAAGVLAGCATTPQESMKSEEQALTPGRFYLPDATASRVVSVTNTGPATTSILIQTHRAAVKETGPEETVAHFGEVYSYSPTFVAVHRDEPTQIRFWNLQPDDHHTFMLVGPHFNVLMNVLLPPVQETAYVFTFHEEGLFNFYCAMHQPGMFGQILVLPPRAP
jgi:plastocyanin